MQVSEHVGPKQVGLLLSQPYLEHGPNDAMESLHVGKPVDFAG